MVLALTPKQRKLFDPYLEGSGPNESGEQGLHCPLHEDSNRSASINFKKGSWICFVGCGAGPINDLVRRHKSWVPRTHGSQNGGRSRGGSAGPTSQTDVPTSVHVAGWASALQSRSKELKELKKRRLLNDETIKRFGIGWVNEFRLSSGRLIAKDCYSIPILDADGRIVNIRFYQLDPVNERRKIWHIPNLGPAARLYPLQSLADDPESIVICEGEMDSLICNQMGIPAITRTASATTWDFAWGQIFSGKRVYLIHDCDKTGHLANVKLMRALRGVALSVVVVRLPYKMTKNKGKDLTDFFQDGYTKDDLLALMADADAEQAPDKPEDNDPTDANLLETIDSKRVGIPQRIFGTVRGKVQPGHSIARTVELECTMDKDESTCGRCPLYAAGGKAKIQIAADDPDTLKLIGATNLQTKAVIAQKFGLPKCDRVQMNVTEYQAAEHLIIRSSIDHVRLTQSGSDFDSREIISVGRHDTKTNTTVEIIGALWPDPKTQKNVFLAHVVKEVETNVDNFQLSDEIVKSLSIFRPSKGQSPLAKRIEIARELSREVTKIYGRDEMHVALDLVWHSALSYILDGQVIDRGWVELLVVGDTRTGKSEAAQRLQEHYRAGEHVSCESASFAGIIGGLQQNSGGSWTINWGIIVMNDRRLVICDELSGLSLEEISKLSSVRSSGVAELTKINSDRAPARTRLIFLGNPRNSNMSRYLYGVDAIKGLVGNDEDIARFTLAMCVRTGEIPLGEINKPRRTGKLNYTSDLCNALIMWIWSRKREQIKFRQSAVDEVYAQSIKMGNKYIETPPLIQAANVRTKIGSIAVALAGSTFSTDKTATNIIVKREHVIDAVKFIDHIYGMETFGYLERSNESHNDEKRARASSKRVRSLLKKNPELRKFLRMTTRFKRQDLEEILNYSRESANGTVNELYEMRMIEKQGGFVIIKPILHEILRGH